MLESRRGPDLLEESIGAQRLRYVGAKHLHGHGAIVLEVMGPIDRGHATLTKELVQSVAIGECGAKELRSRLVGEAYHGPGIPARVDLMRSCNARKRGCPRSEASSGSCRAKKSWRKTPVHRALEHRDCPVGVTDKCQDLGRVEATLGITIPHRLLQPRRERRARSANESSVEIVKAFVGSLAGQRLSPVVEDRA